MTDWRFISTDLATGLVRGVVSPVEASWGWTLNRPTEGEMVFPLGRKKTRQVTLDTYDAAVARFGPAVHWRLGEEPDETVAVDSSGHDRHLEYRGGVTLGVDGAVADDVDTAVHLDGVDGRVAGTLTTGIDNAFTVASWVKLDSVDASRRTAVSWGQAVTTGFVLCATDAGIPQENARMWVRLGATWAYAHGPRGVGIDEWFHIVGTWDGAVIRLYVNGQQIDETVTAGDTALTNPDGDTIAIGARDSETNHWLDGSADEVSIYNHALTADEVAELYDVGVMDPKHTTTTYRTTDLRDVFPHRTAIYALRNGLVVGHGYVKALQAEGGAGGRFVRVGLQSLGDYLMHRTLRRTLTFSNVEQTQILAALVEEANTDGIGFEVEAGTSAHLRNRTYHHWNRHKIGELIHNLTDVVDGPDFEVQVRRNTAVEGIAFRRVVVIEDRLERETNLVLKANRGGINSYGIDIDAEGHATLIDAIGNGEEEDMLIATAQDSSGTFPRFDATVAHKSVEDLDTLTQQATGHLAVSSHPRGAPYVVQMNPGEPAPGSYRAGDKVRVILDDGGIRYDGRARIVGWKHTWNEDGEQVDFTLEPQTPLVEALEVGT